MNAIPASEAKQNLYKLINDVNVNSTPVTIIRETGNAVLIGEKDWLAIEETIYLNSIPGMVESIVEGGKEALSDCLKYNEAEAW